jgi:hypothetical protein
MAHPETRRTWCLEHRMSSVLRPHRWGSGLGLSLRRSYVHRRSRRIQNAGLDGHGYSRKSLARSTVRCASICCPVSVACDSKKFPELGGWCRRCHLLEHLQGVLLHGESGTEPEAEDLFGGIEVLEHVSPYLVFLPPSGHIQNAKSSRGFVFREIRRNIRPPSASAPDLLVSTRPFPAATA